MAKTVYFDFTPKLRDEILDDCASMFVHWVLNGNRRENTHGYDHPWDNSGSVTQKEVGEGALLFWYKTLAEWMEEELTANQRPTFESGYGFDSLVFEAEIREDIENDALFKTFYASLKVEKQKFIEDILDQNENWFIGCLIFTEALIGLLKQIPTSIAWRKLKDRVIKSRQREAEAAERVREFRSTCKQFAQDLLKQSLPLLAQRRIERPTRKEEGLAVYLLEILKQVEIKYVVAVAEVGLPGNYSNSVSADIDRTTKAVLESRIEEAQAIDDLGTGFLNGIESAP